VANIEGVVSIRRFEIEWQKVTELEAPQWRSLAIYEIEAEDPVVVTAIKEDSRTDMMPLSDAMTKSGVVQVLGKPVWVFLALT